MVKFAVCALCPSSCHGKSKNASSKAVIFGVPTPADDASVRNTTDKYPCLGTKIHTCYWIPALGADNTIRVRFPRLGRAKRQRNVRLTQRNRGSLRNAERDS